MGVRRRKKNGLNQMRCIKVSRQGRTDEASASGFAGLLAEAGLAAPEGPIVLVSSLAQPVPGALLADGSEGYWSGLHGKARLDSAAPTVDWVRAEVFG
jgi:hypothetical protein